MATAKQLAAEAAKVLWKGAALITAADWEDGEVKRVQVYFECDGEAVMDTVDIKDLIDKDNLVFAEHLLAAIVNSDAYYYEYDFWKSNA